MYGRFLPIVFALLCGLGARGATADEPARGSSLNARIDGLAAYLAGQEDAAARELGAALQTLAGRAALLEVLKEYEEEERAKTAVAVYERVLADADSEAFQRRCKERGEEVEKLRAFLGAIADKLQGASRIDDDLRIFLRRDDAADVVFDAWIRERRPLT